MSHSFSAAVIGGGFIGPVHVEALRRAGVIVRGVLGSTPAKSRQLAERLALPVAYESLSQLLADRAIDAVHIATPNRFHFEQAAAALRAGKHVLCEKPLAMNAGEAAELVRLAKETGRAAGVAYNIRYYPLCHEAKARVAEGRLGKLLSVHGSYVQDWLLFDTDYNWRVEAEAGGALRAVADIGTHWLDLVQFITGQHVFAVCADLQTVHHERRRPIGGAETFSGVAQRERATEAVAVDTDDGGAVLLEFDNGARGSLWVSQATAGRKNCLRFEIAGANESLAWNSETPNELWIGHRERANESLLRDPSLMSEAAARIASFPGGHNEGFPDSFKQLFRDFYGYIAAGDFEAIGNFPTFADGLREIELCEAVLESHRRRSWIELPRKRRST